ncbi:hypothetical protein [Ectopseudomonas alcaliphila]|uniref:DNA segregation ATPase FtsK/SpoIIIE, S-DNA-T family n=1 Tax=Ectopseudomonas alcaliphila TaxID=101564 RepID=A0A1G7JD22_9GAMM|nr:hypothetical protein [Pseudomonas alcaliphila]MDX5995412.1 DNA translocase FtsK [Pseudomonas alcaliphila]MDX5995457.1 DNA translocase FtsK [Pseudomonas alcaliphila]SDF22796.1 DNA segregation ATPase FtsK/SpoIIIE, S-DNA-T family [Pseudomonas alcaliphila]
MKIAHRAIIERAESEGLFPAEMASELLEHDLVQLTIDQLKGQTAVYGSLSEQGQQEVIERVTLAVKDAVKMAIRIIAANGVAAVPVDVKRVQVDEKKLTVTLSVDGKDPRKHDLVDSAGRLCMLVMAPDEYGEGLDGIKPDRDQHELPLSAAELAAGMGLKPSGSDEEEQEAGSGTLLDDLNAITLDEVTQLVRKSGDSIDLTFLQQHLAVDSSKATSLLFQLVEQGVIAVENSDAANSADYTYKVLPFADAS